MKNTCYSIWGIGDWLQGFLETMRELARTKEAWLQQGELYTAVMARAVPAGRVAAGIAKDFHAGFT